MKIKRLLLLLALSLLVASCTSYKNVPYLQNPEAVNDFEEVLPLYDAKIMPKDVLSIRVSGRYESLNGFYSKEYPLSGRSP